VNGTRPSLPAKHDFRISAGKRHRLRAHFWNDAKSPSHSARNSVASGRIVAFSATSEQHW
jgi:hypothetical protein